MISASSRARNCMAMMSTQWLMYRHVSAQLLLCEHVNLVGTMWTYVNTVPTVWTCSYCVFPYSLHLHVWFGIPASTSTDFFYTGIQVKHIVWPPLVFLPVSIELIDGWHWMYLTSQWKYVNHFITSWRYMSMFDVIMLSSDMVQIATYLYVLHGNAFWVFWLRVNI